MIDQSYRTLYDTNLYFTTFLTVQKNRFETRSRFSHAPLTTVRSHFPYAVNAEEFELRLNRTR